jgi:hypothetical protein
MSRVTSFGSRETAPEPLLVRSFQGGVIGWIVVFGAMIIELAGGAVTYQKFMAPAVVLPVLILPAAVALGIGIVQWWQVRQTGADPASWWHLGAIVAAVLIWFMWPIDPGTLDGNTGSARAACNVLPSDNTAECLHRAAQALDASHLAWWLSLGLIGVAALLARRSRIAAWAALPIALAGCQLASHFLEQLLLHFQPIS